MQKKFFLGFIISLLGVGSALALPSIRGTSGTVSSRAAVGSSIRASVTPTSATAPATKARLSASSFFGSRGHANVLKPSVSSGSGNGESEMTNIEQQVEALQLQMNNLSENTYTKDAADALLEDKQDSLPSGTEGQVLSKTQNGVAWVSPAAASLPTCPSDGKNYVLVVKSTGDVDCEEVVSYEPR